MKQNGVDFKTISIAVIIFLLIILFLVLNSGFVNKESKTMQQNLQLIEEAIRTEDFEGAEVQLDRFEKLWKKDKAMFSITMHHSELKDVSSNLNRLSVYVSEKDKIEALVELSQMTDTIQEIPGHTTWKLDDIL